MRVLKATAKVQPGDNKGWDSAGVRGGGGEQMATQLLTAQICT